MFGGLSPSASEARASIFRKAAATIGVLTQSNAGACTASLVTKRGCGHARPPRADSHHLTDAGLSVLEMWHRVLGTQPAGEWLDASPCAVRQKDDPSSAVCGGGPHHFRPIGGFGRQPATSTRSRSVRFFTSVRTFCRGPSPIFLAGPFRISCWASRPCSPIRKPFRSHKDNVSGRIGCMKFSSMPRPYYIISYCLASMYFVTPLTRPTHA